MTTAPLAHHGGTYLLTAAVPTSRARDNLADIAAQVAANRSRRATLASDWSRGTRCRSCRPTCGTSRSGGRSEDAVGPRRSCPTARHEFIDHLDDGSPIAVAITIAGDRATIDFTGTGPVLPGNLNANRAIVTAAVMYVLRCLIDEDIPLNEGVLAPVEIVLPPSAC